MDFWRKAQAFAEDAAKRSQELTKEAAKRSQEFTIGSSKLSDIVSETAKRSKEIAAEASKRSQEITIGSSKLSDIVSETAKRSKEIAAEASKRADQIKTEAIKRADQIKSLAEGITPPGALARTVPALDSQLEEKEKEKELERFGVTEELREFVKEITMSTFQDFPLEDDSEMSEVPMVSNVRQDLTQWQEKHACLVLSTVKEISRLRYELCPRTMKERKFWRIYFIIVNNHVAPYEKRYMEEAMQKSAEQVKDNVVEEKAMATSKPEVKKSNHESKTLTSSSAEQDLDIFLLGGDSDEGPDDGEGDFDDFDKMVDSSDEEKGKL
ncbi:hypothetical protein P3X46_031220 [Hevea brasiliensis]|uniref:BSD domain-containing protein n=1 Tax=Hevea brasiliensis TaxID=3981 RepID=A0ABQ9KJL9_HEVBR|nr:uncharacterized protein LOC110643895 isoform X2 [Hevea brasiliensis]KAJ9140588.1 hypothetical protein P3X46_031220 [Hevea brasiliensis]